MLSKNNNSWQHLLFTLESCACLVLGKALAEQGERGQPKSTTLCTAYRETQSMLKM